MYVCMYVCVCNNTHTYMYVYVLYIRNTYIYLYFSRLLPARANAAKPLCYLLNQYY